MNSRVRNMGIYLGLVEPENYDPADLSDRRRQVLVGTVLMLPAAALLIAGFVIGGTTGHALRGVALGLILVNGVNVMVIANRRLSRRDRDN